MEKRIITISREFGSGGRFIGEEVAKKLGIAYYDKNIINEIAEKSGLSPEYVQKNAELSPKKACLHMHLPDVISQENHWNSDIERLSTIMTLHDIGFTNGEIEKYMRMLLKGKFTEKERLKMLNDKRLGTLDEIHFKERQLDRLDYLRFEIQKENKI